MSDRAEKSTEGTVTVTVEKTEDTRDSRERLEILYKVNDRPPLPLLLVLSFQQFLTMFGATFSFPFLMAEGLCLDGDPIGMSEVISTVIFVAGLSTILQTTVGVRLPIVQSVSYSFVSPFLILLSLDKWKCEPCVSESDPAAANGTICGSDDHVEMWHTRMRELQGALLVSCLLQILIGFTGLVGFLLNYIGPLTITPTITMIGLSLFDAASFKAQGQWWIALTTLALIAIFSQYLRNINIPFCSISREQGCIKSSFQLFALFPVLLAVGLSWLLCYIFTLTDVLPPTKGEWGYLARTDVQGDALSRAPWFRFPYPGQWGMPTVSVAGVCGCISAILASIVESVGDYFACARLSGAPPPPKSAVSRGIGMEGITTLLAGMWGVGGGTTSYSENIGAIGITKVGSLVVVQVTGVMLVVFGCVGKFSALFATMPDPIVGGLFLAMFGMVTAVGISNLQYVDLNSSRNLFIVGVTIILGLCLPKWMSTHPKAIDTGNEIADNVLTVICSTSMLVAGVLAFILDNTVPGTREERGLNHWDQSSKITNEDEALRKVYDLPFIQPWLNKLPATKYMPFCNGYIGDRRGQAVDSDAALNEQTKEAAESTHANATHATRL